MRLGESVCHTQTELSSPVPYLTIAFLSCVCPFVCGMGGVHEALPIDAYGEDGAGMSVQDAVRRPCVAPRLAREGVVSTARRQQPPLPCGRVYRHV